MTRKKMVWTRVAGMRDKKSTPRGDRGRLRRRVALVAHFCRRLVIGAPVGAFTGSMAGLLCIGGGFAMSSAAVPDVSWSPPHAQQRVSLADLGPWSHMARVTAGTVEAWHGNPPASPTFAVPPKRQETWWLQALLLLLIAGAIASGPWARQRNLRREREVLNARVAEWTHDRGERDWEPARQSVGRGDLSLDLEQALNARAHERVGPRALRGRPGRNSRLPTPDEVRHG